MMEPITIQLKECVPARREGEPLRFGVPMVRGVLHDISRLSLSTPEGTPLHAQFSKMALWPADSSVRWICVETQLAGVGGNAPSSLILSNAGHQTLELPSIDHSPRGLFVRYGDCALRAHRGSLEWQWTSGGRHTFPSCLILDSQENQPCTAELDTDWQVRTSGPASTLLSCEGWWVTNDGNRLARFRCGLRFYRNGLVEVEATIHNPRRSRHPGGLWDLGDAGSTHFGAMAIETGLPECNQIRLALTSDSNIETFNADQPLVLHQESSGGEHWDSTNHINASGKVLPRFRGYQLARGKRELARGDRCDPLVEASSSDFSFTAYLSHFWQNFPSALEVGPSVVRTWLFPADKPEPYELQGGERKTQRALLGYGKDLEALNWAHSPIIPVVSAKHYESSGAFAWFRSNQPVTLLDELIQEGLGGTSSFFSKREDIDEYGWRNFGDLFADHETLYQKEGERPHISHYNNQYDGIYGFARQFAMTGNPRWFELMDDLARHVVDIDIYHTDEDRAEYNNGLFWHTDHYLDAHTCTHRTFTRHNNSSSTPGQLGGGPAAEHCYTTGHLYHYWLTGNSASREVVLKLASWMETLHQGQRGLLAEVLALKKQELPKLKAMLRGDQVSAHRYPFTRGTGNYITALLDAHLLEPSNGWLARAESVLRQTIHPADDIEKRDLLDTETGWSYLILLASIARYLHIKEEIGERDTQWRYARDSFLHYTEWMLKHEKPFLSDTSELEFANDTWTAQDIRKAMLMFQAAQEDPHKAPDYQAKGREWLDYVTTALQTSPERGLTRLQIILLQNYGPQHLDTPDGAQCPAKQDDSSVTYQTPLLGWGSLVGQIVARLMKGLLHFRPRREKAWLAARLDR